MKKQSKFFLSSFLLLTCLLFAQTTFAQQTYTYTGNSVFENPTAWKNGRVPQIDPGVTLIIEGNCRMDDVDILDGVKLIIRSGGVFKIEGIPPSTQVTVDAGGTLDIDEFHMDSNLNVKGLIKARRLRMNLTAGGKVEVGF